MTALLTRASVLQVAGLQDCAWRIGDPARLSDGREGYIQGRTISARGNTLAVESLSVRTIGGTVVSADANKVSRIYRTPRAAQGKVS